MIVATTDKRNERMVLIKMWYIEQNRQKLSLVQIKNDSRLMVLIDGSNFLEVPLPWRGHVLRWGSANLWINKEYYLHSVGLEKELSMWVQVAAEDKRFDPPVQVLCKSS